MKLKDLLQVLDIGKYASHCITIVLADEEVSLRFIDSKECKEEVDPKFLAYYVVGMDVSMGMSSEDDPDIGLHPTVRIIISKSKEKHAN